MRPRSLVLPALALVAALHATPPQSKPAPQPARPAITSPKAALGFDIGDDCQLANYTRLAAS